MSLAHWLEADARWSQRLHLAERPGLRRRLAIFLAHSADSWFWLAGLAILAVAGGPAWRRWALILGAAVLATAALVLAIKFTIRRRRPEGDWGAIYRNADPHSFPSGHAARAIMLAVLGLALGPGWFALILCVWGPLVALARVAMGVHYVSDIAAGAALGVLFGLFFGGTQTLFAPYYNWLVW
jgi:undecaprenyl-diphosphatase